MKKLMDFPMMFPLKPLEEPRPLFQGAPRVDEHHGSDRRPILRRLDGFFAAPEDR
jgi:hypothetical protein